MVTTKKYTNCIICKSKLTGKPGHEHMGLCSSKCFTADFWLNWLKHKDDEMVARINHEHYYIEGEEDNSSFRGCAGRKFIIKFNSGEIVETTNLWCQGKIPEAFYVHLPDNAVFIKDYKKQGFIQE